MTPEGLSPGRASWPQVPGLVHRPEYGVLRTRPSYSCIAAVGVLKYSVHFHLDGVVDVWLEWASLHDYETLQFIIKLKGWETCVVA